MTALDPMRRMWEALEANGRKPRGPLHQYRADCPVCDTGAGDNLAIGEGSDQRVLLHCKRQDCEPRNIAEAIGLTVRDLFPVGHRNGHRARPQRAVKPRPLTPGAALLDLLTAGGFVWKAHLLGTACPFCDEPHAYLTVHDGGGLDVDCPNGCIADEVRRAVETRAAIAEKGLAL